jgi:hypothetical protein
MLDKENIIKKTETRPQLYILYLILINFDIKLNVYM